MNATLVEPSRVVVARYGELWLKGKNRRQFESRLVHNLRRALEPITSFDLQRTGGQLVIHPRDRVADVFARTREVFGFASVSPAVHVPATVDAIVATSASVLQEALDGLPSKREITFRVATRRGDKSFPMTSSELDRHVADAILEPHVDRLRVQLVGAELELGIQVREEGAYVYAERVPGAGGLPVGTLGRVVCLLSGGIDSPVAAYMAMKRGCEVACVGFHSFPFVGDTYLAKVRRLVRRLARYQGVTTHYEVPFAAVQTAIRDSAPPSYRTVLYRRMMQRIAERVARRERALALVTGESLGQVASQTLENLTRIGEVVSLPVIRPLVAFDKTETIAVARRIGTFDLSIEHEPDCCTVFQPKKPVIRGDRDVCLDAEAELDVEALVEAACAEAVRHRIEPE